jgi:hypothetical protein
MIENRVVKTIPVHQRATGVRMSRPKRPRMNLSVLRHDCMVFSGFAEVGGRKTLEPYWTCVVYMASVNVSLVRHTDGCPRIIEGCPRVIDGVSSCKIGEGLVHASVFPPSRTSPQHSRPITSLEARYIRKMDETPSFFHNCGRKSLLCGGVRG